MRRRRYHPVAVVLVLMLCTLGLSCSAWQPTVTPPQTPVTVPPAFTETGETPAPERWWTAFDDNALDALVVEAMTGNFNLRTTWDRLAQARATARAAGAERFVQLNGTAGAGLTGAHTDATGTDWSGDFSLGLAASYEVDLWGRVRATRDAAALDVLASEQDLRAAAISLSAEIAGTWYQLVQQRGEMRVLETQAKTNSDYLTVITLKYEKGQVSASDVLQQRQTLEATRGEQIALASQLKQTEHRLAVLVGRVPVAFAAPQKDVLPAVPALPATGVPAIWVQRRPDVRAAFIRIRAADERVAAAIADQFPTVSLSGSFSTGGEHVRDLFDNWLASLAANLAAPILDGDRRKAEVERTRAVASERLNSYGQTLLEALKEVEDALVAERKQRELVASLEKQLALSEQATERIRDMYSKGTTEFTRYLTTLLSNQRLERTLLSARRQLVQTRVDLYRALGGGWDLREPPRGPRRVTGPFERTGIKE